MQKWMFLGLVMLVLACSKETEYDTKEMTEDFSVTENWMSDLIEKYPNKTVNLKSICIPAAHDAAIYELNYCLGGNFCNTQTQNANFYTMLKMGIRQFDLRPTLRNDTFRTYHATSCNGLGCEGDELINVLNDTKRFLDEHQELVILEISHFCNTTPFDANFLQVLNTHLGDRIYKETGAAQNLITQPITSFFNDNKGKVILRMEGLNTSTENRIAGYFSPSSVPIAGSYANKYVFEQMRDNQQAKLINYDETSNSLFQISWTLTLNTTLSINCLDTNATTSIYSLAVDARPRLEPTLTNWIAQNVVNASKIPNVISVDFADQTVTQQCIRLSELVLAN